MSRCRGVWTVWFGYHRSYSRRFLSVRFPLGMDGMGARLVTGLPSLAEGILVLVPVVKMADFAHSKIG